MSSKKMKQFIGRVGIATLLVMQGLSAPVFMGSGSNIAFAYGQEVVDSLRDVLDMYGYAQDSGENLKTLKRLATRVADIFKKNPGIESELNLAEQNTLQKALGVAGEKDLAAKLVKEAAKRSAAGLGAKTPPPSTIECLTGEARTALRKLNGLSKLSPGEIAKFGGADEIAHAGERYALRALDAIRANPEVLNQLTPLELNNLANALSNVARDIGEPTLAQSLSDAATAARKATEQGKKIAQEATKKIIRDAATKVLPKTAACPSASKIIPGVKEITEGEARNIIGGAAGTMTGKTPPPSAWSKVFAAIGKQFKLPTSSGIGAAAKVALLSPAGAITTVVGLVFQYMEYAQAQDIALEKVGSTADSYHAALFRVQALRKHLGEMIAAQNEQFIIGDQVELRKQLLNLLMLALALDGSNALAQAEAGVISETFFSGLGAQTNFYGATLSMLEELQQPIKLQKEPTTCPVQPPVCEQPPAGGGQGARTCNDFGDTAECTYFGPPPPESPWVKSSNWVVLSGPVRCKILGREGDEFRPKGPPEWPKEYWDNLPPYPRYVPPGLPGESVCNDSNAVGAPAGEGAAPGATAKGKPAPTAGGKPAATAAKPAGAPRSVASGKVGKGGGVTPLQAPGGAAVPLQKSVRIPVQAIQAAIANKSSTPVPGTPYNLTCQEKKPCVVTDRAQNNKVVARFAPPKAGKGGKGVTFRPRIPVPTGKPAPAPAKQFDFGDLRAPYPTTLNERGIRHRIGVVWLGGAPQSSAVDAELDAKRPDSDQFDDGLALARIEAVPPPPDAVRVTRAPAPQGKKPLSAAFLNVLDDRNANGRWEPNEWVVQNQVVRFTAGDTQTVSLWRSVGDVIAPVILSRKGGVRITVSLVRLKNYRGLAHQPLFGGETEDYLFKNGEFSPPPGIPVIDTGGLRPTSGGSCGASQDCLIGETCVIENNIGKCVEGTSPAPASASKPSTRAPAPSFLGWLAGVLGL